MAIDLGDVLRLEFTNRSGAGIPVSSSEVMLTITLPDGTDAVLEDIEPVAEGVYQYDYVTTQAGRHKVHWVAGPPAPGAHSEAFDVLPADLPHIISLADAKAQLNIETSHEDDEIRDYISAVTWVVERHISRATYRRSITEEYVIEPGGLLVLNWPPVVQIESMSAVNGSYTWDPASLHCSPSGVVTSPWGRTPEGHVAVTYTAGEALVPYNIQMAARIVLQSAWQTQRGSRQGSQAQAPWGAAKAGGLENSMNIVGKGFEIPTSALMLLDSGAGFA